MSTKKQPEPVYVTEAIASIAETIPANEHITLTGVELKELVDQALTTGASCIYSRIPMIGSSEEFSAFVQEAQSRGLKRVASVESSTLQEYLRFREGWIAALLFMDKLLTLPPDENEG